MQYTRHLTVGEDKGTIAPVSCYASMPLPYVHVMSSIFIAESGGLTDVVIFITHAWNWQ